MFGYIKPNIPELRVRDKTRYEAWYCGLCRCLGERFGLFARACLSYDCAFLALLLHAVNGEPPMPCTPRTCTFKPLGRKKPMLDGSSASLDFAAAVCVMLSIYKLGDDVNDGKPLYGLAKPLLKRAFSKAVREQPAAASALKTGLSRLAEVETARDPSPDLAASTFGGLLRDVLLTAPAPEASFAPLGELGFHLGRYIYLLDAWDDRREDEKRGNYNPFLISGIGSERARFLVDFSINSAISAYNLLEVRSERELIDNIVAQGCFAAADAVWNREDAKA